MRRRVNVGTRNDIALALRKPISDARDSITNGRVIWSGYPVVFDATGYKPSGNEIYISTFNLPSSSAVVESNASQDFIGIYQIDVNVPMSTGTADANEIADNLAGLYPIGSNIAFGGVSVKIVGNDHSPVIVQGGFSKVSLSINYSSFN